MDSSGILVTRIDRDRQAISLLAWTLKLFKKMLISNLVQRSNSTSEGKNTYSLKQPDLYYFETIKMMSQT